MADTATFRVGLLYRREVRVLCSEMEIQRLISDWHEHKGLLDSTFVLAVKSGQRYTVEAQIAKLKRKLDA